MRDDASLVGEDPGRGLGDAEAEDEDANDVKGYVDGESTVVAGENGKSLAARDREPQVVALPVATEKEAKLESCCVMKRIACKSLLWWVFGSAGLVAATGGLTRPASIGKLRRRYM